MGMLPIDSLEVGMVLASDVNDRTGRLLLGAGAELTMKHIHIFRTWGVPEVAIAGIEAADETSRIPAEFDPADVAAAEADLAPLFRNNDTSHPVIKELLQLAAIKRLSNAVK